MARFALALLAPLALWGCTGDGHPTAPLTNVAVTAPAPSPIPAGWVPVQPSAERLECALHALDDWRVEIEEGAVKLTKAATMELNTGPPVPFPIPSGPMSGSRHVLAVDGGFLVGYDNYEWGGSLHWYATDGSGHRELADKNVRALVALGPDAAVAIEGLAHLDISEGRMRWLERRGDAFAVARVTQLPDAARAGAAAGGTIYVLTTSSLLRIGPDRRATVVQPVETPGLFPDNMAIDPGGALWIGMRHLVLRLSPGRGRFTETWIVREGCRREALVDADCICRG